MSNVVLPNGSAVSLPEKLGLDVPFIFASGYLEHTEDLRRIQDLGYSFLQKPYDISTLYATIDTVLRGHRRQPQYLAAAAISGGSRNIWRQPQYLAAAAI